MRGWYEIRMQNPAGVWITLEEVDDPRIAKKRHVHFLSLVKSRDIGYGGATDVGIFKVEAVSVKEERVPELETKFR